MASLYELRSSYEKQLEEEQNIINLRQQYTDLLTSSISAAQKTYESEAAQAAQQASYDISGAYANYLKQQRGVMSQSNLFSGTKQELSDVLQHQYSSAYSQAQAAQVSSAMSAYEAYLKNAQEAYSTMSENKELVDKLVQERASRATTFDKLYQQFRGIENSDLLESSVYNPATGEYPVYTLNKETGRYELTDYGKDWYAEGLVGKVDITNEKGETRAMSFEDWLKEQGDEKQIEEWQKYAKDIMKDVAGIEYSTNEKGELTLPKYDEEAGKVTKLKTKGYIDTITKPKLTVHGTDYGYFDFGETASQKIKNTTGKVEEYALKLGLTDEDVREITGGMTVRETINWIAAAGDKLNDGYSLEEIMNSQGANEFVVKLLTQSYNMIFKSLKQGAVQDAVTEIYNNFMSDLNNKAKTKYTNK